MADAIRTLVAQHRPTILVLDLSRVQDIEYSALKMLQEGDQRNREQGITLLLAGCNPGVLDVVRKSGLADQLGPERLLVNSRAAIERWQSHADGH